MAEAEDPLTDPATTDDDAPKAAAPKSTIQVQSKLKSASLHVSRQSMLEYMNQRDWWRQGQWNIWYTTALWLIFVALMYLRSRAEDSFLVKEGLMKHLGDIRAHPSISHVVMTNRGEGATKCTCSCKSTLNGMPTDACDTDAGSEVLHFKGLLPVAAQGNLSSNACSDMPNPLALFATHEMGTNSIAWNCVQWAYYSGDVGSQGCAAEVITANASCTSGCQDLFAEDPQAMRWRCPATCGYCGERSEEERDSMTEIQLDTIAEPDDAWLWVEHGLLPDIWSSLIAPQVGLPAMPVIGRNAVIGGLRARQVRSSTVADCQVDAGLRTFYQPSCRSADPATDAYGPAGDYSFSPRDAEAKDGVYEALFDTERSGTDAFELAKYLRRNKWLDRSTKSFQMDALLLNAEANLYGLLNVQWTFNADGGVQQSIRVGCFQALAGEMSFMDFLPELAWLALIGYILYQELGDLVCSARHCRCGEYFSSWWNIVDWVSIGLGFVLAWFYFIISRFTISLTEDVVALPRAPLAANLDIAAYRQQWSDVIDSAAYIYWLREWLGLSLFWYTSVITLRFMKGFQGQSKLALMQITLTNAFDDIIHFFITMFVMFVNFVLGGRLLFGSEVKDWTRFDRSVSASLRLMLGNLDFQEMYEVAPITATIWFWLFLISVFCVLMNLLVAIVIDHFSNIRAHVGQTTSILTDSIRGWNDWKWRLEWRYDKIVDRDFLDALSDPYADLIEGLLDNIKASDEMQAASRASCLGLRLERRDREDQCAEALEGPGTEDVTAMELRQMGADPTTAEHLIEECDLVNRQDRGVRYQSKLQQVRFFVKLLRRHRQELTLHCEEIEHGALEDYDALHGSMDRLEASLDEAMQNFMYLKDLQVDSLALVPPKLEFQGTSFRDIYIARLGDQPSRTLKGPGVLPPAILEESDGALRQAALADGFPAQVAAIGDNNAADNGAAPANPALADRAGNIPALTEGFDDGAQ